MKLTKNQEEFLESYKSNENIFIAQTDSSLSFADSYGSMYYVYILANPMDGKIFYIGKGKGKRAEHHLRDNKNSRIDNEKKHSVINHILSKNLEPLIFIFQNELSEPEALHLEKILIIHLRPFITNKLSGSLHKHERDKVWAESMIRRTKPFEVWVSEKERLPYEIEIYKDMRNMLEEIASGKLILWKGARTGKDGKIEFF